VRLTAREPLNPKLTNTGLSRRARTTDGTNRNAAALKLTNSRMERPQCGQVFTFPNLFSSREKRPIEPPQCGHFILVPRMHNVAVNPERAFSRAIGLNGLLCGFPWCHRVARERILTFSHL
jgi:hypothetical protein